MYLCVQLLQKSRSAGYMLLWGRGSRGSESFSAGLNITQLEARWQANP